MNKSYHWKIQPTEEIAPHYVFTETDSVLDAAKQFEETWVMYIHKIATTTKYDDILQEVS